ncbi:MAG: efflux RND transporter permease subunit [Planctomycetota bacterium]
MKTIVTWALKNTPAMNTLLAGLVVVGTISLFTLRREVFPEFELEVVLINVPYPGADPEEISAAICEKVEEALTGIEYVKESTSISQVGLGSVILELEADVPDVQKIVNEVRSEVDQIASFFPELAEDHEVKQITFREAAIRVGIIAPEPPAGRDDETRLADEVALRELAEEVRAEIAALSGVSQANILGERPFQIDVELPEEALRRYGLSLLDVATRLRDENIELPGGTLKGPSQDVLLKGDNKRLTGRGVAELPLVTGDDGVSLTVADLGVVKDGFDSGTVSRTYIDGRPGMIISVDRTKQEDLLAMTAQVRDYIDGRGLPEGYAIKAFDDRSTDVKDRIDLLVRNGSQGLLLVFIALALFLELRLAFWVALGIPISILGSCIILLYVGATLNMLSLFAFLMGLGIIVDDAIVVGENIYAHREMGKSWWRAAIDGTAEVFPSVCTAVTTTIIALCPMFFVSGIMGKFIAVMPTALVAAFLISLFESLLILPCHLCHEGGHGFLARLRENLPTPIRWLLGAAVVAKAAFLASIATAPGTPLSLQIAAVVAATVGGFVACSVLGVIPAMFRVAGEVTPRVDRGLAAFLDRYYVPALRWALRAPGIVVSIAIAGFLTTLGYYQAGFVAFNVFPKLDSIAILATVTYPDGTPADVTDDATREIEQALFKIGDEHVFNGKTPFKVVRRSVGYQTINDPANPAARSGGPHVGQVFVELWDTTDRNVTSQQLVAEWRAASPEIAGAESVQFESPSFGPAPVPVEFKLLASRTAEARLPEVVEKVKAKLATYPGVFDVTDDDQPGKAEFRIRVKPDALSLGVTQAQLTNTIRAAYYGAEVMRLQRGRNEVKLMVRFPAEDRRSLADFEGIRVRTPDGLERPIGELAEIEIGRGPSEVQRLDGLRSITVLSDLDEAVGNASDIVADLKAGFMPDLLADYPGVEVRWKGAAEQTAESTGSLLVGFVIALILMYGLLTLEFRSYLQPALIMFIVPFGFVGAIIGHAFMDIPISLFSLFGMVALTGVVVNDSIVLIDFINHRVRDGLPLDEALVDAGRRRFRPVLLTSMTTVAGLIPMLTETSFQAQILIPMATSLCFGLMLATVLVVFLVPTTYKIYGNFGGGKPFGENEEDESETDADFDFDRETSREPALAGV